MSASLSDLAIPKSILDTDLYKVSLIAGLNLWIHPAVIAFYAAGRFAPFSGYSSNISLYKP